MNITVIGAGYVGLPSATHWSNVHDVVLFDLDEAKIAAINKAKEGIEELHVHEEGLVEAIQKNKDRLSATTDITQALQKAEIIFLAVGTPPTKEGKASLRFIKSAAQMIAKTLDHQALIVTKSTVPPGTGYLVEKILKEHSKLNLLVASCPEFLSEGTAMDDLHSPSRIVIGSDSQEALTLLTSFFTTLHAKEKIIPMNLVSAELTKYLANAMLASRISFMNNAALLCESIGGDIKAVRKALAKDPRIGEKFLYAGFGYGGSCFPKDTHAIAAYAKEIGTPLSLVDATIQVNDHVLQAFCEKIKRSYDSLEGKNFIVWGLGFKAGTNDVRDSQSVKVCEYLLAQGAHLRLFDPIQDAMTNFSHSHQGNFSCVGQYDVQDGDGLIIGNEDEVFRIARIEKLAGMREKKIFDGKNVLVNSEEVKQAGFSYEGVGLGKQDKEKVVAALEKYANE